MRVGKTVPRAADPGVAIGAAIRSQDIKAAHVQSLVEVIMIGDFGKTSMAMPSLFIGQDGKPVVPSDDGLYVIDNGKAWVHALKECEATYKKLEAELLAACPPSWKRPRPRWRLVPR